MSKLQAALDWAARGFAVFPLVPNGKTPAFESSWVSDATTDPTVITAIWRDPLTGQDRGYNIGMHCKDMVVFDLDVKEGKQGVANYQQAGGQFNSLTVQTPSGGFHVYYAGTESANLVNVLDGVDIRSRNGFVVAPGSTIDGVPYQVVVEGQPVALPSNLTPYTQRTYERNDASITGNGDHNYVDNEAAIAAAVNFLQTTDPAIEGMAGDATTFQTAARLVREMSLSEATALDLLWTHYNPRCAPPWSYEELQAKVMNAVRYGTAQEGRLDPAITFANVVVPEAPPTVFEQAGLQWGNAALGSAIPPRPWMVDRMLMAQELTLLLAPGSAGKSSISLAIAAHLAMGRDFGPYRTHCRCRSVIYNGEDNVIEQSRRLYAVCQAYDFPYDEVRSMLMLLSEDDVDMQLVQGGRNPQVNEALVEHIIRIAEPQDVGLIVLDPLVDVHSADETDNAQMNSVMKTIKHVCARANVAAMVLHHTTKAGQEKQENRVGNMDIARGASGIVYKSRIAYTLLTASHKDAEDYGLTDEQRHAWVRLDDAKMNLALADDKATWFAKEGYKIPSGDLVGVLRYKDIKKDDSHLRNRISAILVQTVTANNAGSLSVSQSVAVVKQNEPLWANKTDAEVKKRIEGMYSQPTAYQQWTLHLTRPKDSEGNEVSKTSVMVIN